MYISYGKSVLATNRTYWFFFFNVFIILTFIFGYRKDVGTDYEGYLSIFTRVHMNDPFVLDRFEPGFLALNQFYFNVGLTGNDLLFTFYMITLILLFLSVKQIGFNSSSKISLSIILLLGIGPIFGATNMVRQALVISFFVYLSVVFYNKRFFGTIIGSILGFLMHYSSVIFLMFNLIPKRKISFKYWLLVSITVILFSSTILEYIINLLTSHSEVLGRFVCYMEETEEFRESTGYGIRALFEVFFFLFLAYFSQNINPKGIYFFNLAFIGVLLLYVVKDISILARVAVYFTVFKFLAIPWFLDIFKGKAKTIFILLLIVYSFLAFLRNAMSGQYYPYQNVLF
jgi:hypothetical protein